ncbi:MAG: ligase-associated DNA damage response DEXH box helicase [Hyphomonas sp.]|uniref:ligase-associated DNA damage response DEXH box helicase n=1 Tax=Hyphomonas sp. TaxID=87 RepID=UPI00181022EC|nr:ligase-associated DNA damage response DEXH box helicase [Hyphomonas sp.]MBA3069431.1 ligase-associated DNA damage response DEXH box helicase [Hyphomonas sp.]MBU3919028.1 ligase-associated DNA damage response DEXH box helicase [Alphaproteobacteria bacterium]MBU4063813.1 ligase-associated DNA damage response DEXH box helicase [Alphaproteobacteria bacterium]MBU4164226.1 ligase-associated DNA damage response DEXH box helicase [Alphaproteobacteria bacterium]
MADTSPPAFRLPPAFEAWFGARGWTPRPHQLALAEASLQGDSALLIAPTGGGKTLAGFLGTLVELSERGATNSAIPALHTLYISPLKALAADVQRNLMTPVTEMGLPVRIETRTGDTATHVRQRQRKTPPDILLTTPEQLALLIASDHAAAFFADLRCVIIDEIHALAPSKRGDLLSLGLATLAEWAPACRFVGLSATVRDPEDLARWLDVRKRRESEPEVLSTPLSSKGRGAGVRGQPSSAASVAAPHPEPLLPEGGEKGLSPNVRILTAAGGVKADVDILISRERIPWSGHSGRFAVAEVYEAIQRAKMTLVFVNTRSQAELMFQELWSVNEDGLPIALHHGSLVREQRQKVEAAMAAGQLKAVVCTSTLDLGIDWGEVDLVIQMGAPKGAARLMQRIGRANHRMDEASKAILVPTNRFEVLECRAAEAAVEAGEIDGEGVRTGALDILAQHVMGRACGEGFRLDALFDEVRRAAPYAGLDWEAFELIVDFVATGGYALKTYDRFHRIVRQPDGLWVARTARDKQAHRMNVGAIVEAPMLSVRLASFAGRAGSPPPPAGEVAAKRTEGAARRSAASPLRQPASSSATSPVSGSERRAIRPGRKLGEMEEYFLSLLTPGDTFLFGGEILRLIGIDGMDALVMRAQSDSPAIPTYNGGKFPLTSFLADRVRKMIHDPAQWTGLPDPVREWFEIQALRSAIPPPDHLLVETFPRGDRHYLVSYPFEGRLAHQTLGMLVTRRLERMGARPSGFVASEYAMAVWGLEDMRGLDMDAVFHPDMLGDDLEEWLAESALMKRTFSHCAIISGLIHRNLPGSEKNSRQVSFSADLVYDVLRSHEPDHILLQAARADAATGLLDVRRLSDMLTRIEGRIVHKQLARISPFAVPVMLEVGREPVFGASAVEAVLREAEEDLVRDAMG